jgi:hypothetical protein
MRRVDYWSPIASRCGIHHKPSPSPHEQFMIMNGLYVDHPQMLGINKMKLYLKKTDFLYLRAYFHGLWPDWCFY